MENIKPRTCVMMSTYNGATYLEEQVNSIFDQEQVDISLFIRDDGSTDETLDVIHTLQGIWGEHRIILLEAGKNIGFSRSFWYILKKVGCNFDYYAFSDQDDVWKKKKIINAIRELEKYNYTYTLFTSGLEIVDQDLEYIGVNRFERLKITFGSALTRQRLPGCTFVFNKMLYKLCSRFEMTEERARILSHDAVVYYSCLICGGKVIFTPESEILYRRHNSTTTEVGRGIKKRLWSVFNIFDDWKNYRVFKAQALSEVYYGDATDENKEILKRVINYKNNLRYRLQLAFGTQLKCNIVSIDILYSIAILLGSY